MFYTAASIPPRGGGRGIMLRLPRPASAGCAAGLALLAVIAAAHADGCDEHDPASPARSAEVTLTGADRVDENGDVLRSFIATDSLGKVEVTVVAQSPARIVGKVTAVPDVSRYSRDEGERIKGIAVTVTLTGPGRNAAVTLRLRQVCAAYFRNSYLYY
jgi:hypothetical protein